MKSQRFDLALLDSKMPGIGGQETVSEIRELDPQLPVLSATGSPERPDRELRTAARRLQVLVSDGKCIAV